MHTPGAAMVWLASVCPTVVKLLKSAEVSSTSARQVATAPPPGAPSKSDTAVTARTWSYVAGRLFLRSVVLLPAATAYVTPVVVELHIALWYESHQLLQGLSPPLPARLILATSMLFIAVTRSMPQMIQEVKPMPLSVRTFIAHNLAPGAAPTTPVLSSFAAAIPATWVPWPWPSP